MPEPTLSTEIERLHVLFSNAADKAIGRKWMGRYCLYAGLCHFLGMFAQEVEPEIVPEPEWNDEIDVTEIDVSDNAIDSLPDYTL